MNDHKHPGACYPGSPVCWLEDNDVQYKNLWGGIVQDPPSELSKIAIPNLKPQTKAKVAPPAPCIHLGKIVHPPIAPDSTREYHQCDAGHGVCTECRTCGVPASVQRCGPKCAGYVAEDGEDRMPSITPRHTTRINPTRLEGSTQGRYLNPSIVDFKGRRLMAYRAGLAEARIWITELGADLQPIGGAVRLDLTHPSCLAGQEDPRLFVFGGKLHISFTGVDRKRHGPLPIAHVMLAAITDDLSVERVWMPEYRQRTETEKNWVFFDFTDLACVYSGEPHRVVRWGLDGSAQTNKTDAGALSWTGGLIRGGASPVLSQNEYYHWFHGVKRIGLKSHYTVGLYTFDAEPPFRIRRMTRSPLLVANDRECAARGLHKHSIVFPCGAILDGDRWLLSYGHHDHYCEIAEFDRQAVEDALEVVR